MEDVDVAHFQDFSSCLVFDTLIISLALGLGPTVRFLAVQDSSIGDLVSHSLTHSLMSLLILASSEHCQSTAELL